MPFIYEVNLDASEPSYTLTQHLVEPGTLVGTGQAIAMLSDGTMDFHLQAPKQGLLVAWFAESGTQIDAHNPIARIVCEGTEEALPAVIPQRLG